MIKDEFGNRRFYGMYRGTVFNNKDPLNKRRLRVVVPQVLSNTPTEWAWSREDASTKTAVPSVGQGVWVMFEGGDPSHPIWVGTFGKSPSGHVLIKPTTNFAAPLKSSTFSDGTRELDLTATLVNMAKEINLLKQDVSSLKSRVTALENAPDVDPTP